MQDNRYPEKNMCGLYAVVARLLSPLSSFPMRLFIVDQHAIDCTHHTTLS